MPPPPPPQLPNPTRTTRTRTAWFARAGAVGLILAVPVVTWWLIGPNPGNEVTGIDPYDYDYLFHPPTIDPRLEHAVVGAALVALVLSVVALVVATRARRIDPRWWLPISGLTGAGAIVALAERVTTAAVIGANIGGGIMIMFGIPVVSVLILGSAGMALAFLHKTAVADST